MKEATISLLELPLLVRAEMALKAAVRGALEDHARAGRPAYIWRDGKVVALSPQEIWAELARQRENESGKLTE